MERYFQQRGTRDGAESSRKRAELPASAVCVIGRHCRNGCATAQPLPDVSPPAYRLNLKVMVEKEILPRLRARFSLPRRRFACG